MMMQGRFSEGGRTYDIQTHGKVSKDSILSWLLDSRSGGKVNSSVAVLCNSPPCGMIAMSSCQQHLPTTTNPIVLSVINLAVSHAIMSALGNQDCYPLLQDISYKKGKGSRCQVISFAWVLGLEPRVGERTLSFNKKEGSLDAVPFHFG